LECKNTIFTQKQTHFGKKSIFGQNILKNPKVEKCGHFGDFLYVYKNTKKHIYIKTNAHAPTHKHIGTKARLYSHLNSCPAYLPSHVGISKQPAAQRSSSIKHHLGLMNHKSKKISSFPKHQAISARTYKQTHAHTDIYKFIRQVNVTWI